MLHKAPFQWSSLLLTCASSFPIPFPYFSPARRSSQSRFILPPHSGALNLAVGFNPRWAWIFSTSRQRRLNLRSDVVTGLTVADATWRFVSCPYRGLMVFE